MRRTLPMLLAAATMVALAATPTFSQYYVTGRYYCVDVSSGDDAGDCTWTAQSDQSCQAALNGLLAEVSQIGGDPCKRCTPDIVDNTKMSTGQVDWVQGGPCQGFGN